jgi:hypothetical protein
MSESNEDNPFDPEHDLDCEHITPKTPKTLYDTLLWQALRLAIDVSDTETDVYQNMTDWNANNDPAFSQKDLDKKVHWGLTHFDSKFKGK